MLTVYHLGISQSERIVWLCEELAIPYELVLFQRDPVTRLAPDEYKALHPIGTAPVIRDGDTLLGESGAIIEYIIHRHGGGRLAVPPEAANYPQYLFWWHFANASLMTVEMMKMTLGRVENPDEFRAKIVKSREEKAYALLEKQLGETPYLAGDQLTAADIITLFPLTTMRVFTSKDLSPYPNILAYLQRIRARPAYQRAMAKGDPGFTPLLG